MEIIVRGGYRCNIFTLVGGIEDPKQVLHSALRTSAELLRVRLGLKRGVQFLAHTVVQVHNRLQHNLLGFPPKSQLTHKSTWLKIHATEMLRL